MRRRGGDDDEPRTGDDRVRIGTFGYEDASKEILALIGSELGAPGIKAAAEAEAASARLAEQCSAIDRAMFDPSSAEPELASLPMASDDSRTTAMMAALVEARRLLERNRWPVALPVEALAQRLEGFAPKVKVGDRVRTGDELISFDLDKVATGAKSLRDYLAFLEADIAAGRPEDAARTAMAHQNFLNITMKNWVRSMGISSG